MGVTLRQAPLGASAAPRKTDSTVDTSEIAISLSLDISWLWGRKRVGCEAARDREEVVGS